MQISATPQPDKPGALVFWRLFALLYDALPVIALWFLASAGFTVAYTFGGHHDPHQNIEPFSALQWLLWLVCWTIAGLYGVLSWRRGGQTLGMRPWRLRVVAADGSTPTWRALIVRFVVGNASLLLAGLGFWWAWIDRDRLTWHDRASGTRMRREAKA
jgi:uncharacterized RDD family membrane protein YckC